MALQSTPINRKSKSTAKHLKLTELLLQRTVLLLVCPFYFVQNIEFRCQVELQHPPHKLLRRCSHATKVEDLKIQRRIRWHESQPASVSVQSTGLFFALKIYQEMTVNLVLFYSK